MNADPFPLGIAIKVAAHRPSRWSLVGDMFGDGPADGADGASVDSECGGLAACRGFDNSVATGTPPVCGPLGGAYGSCPECLQ